jgi:hypothetical protein
MIWGITSTRLIRYCWKQMKSFLTRTETSITFRWELNKDACKYGWGLSMKRLTKSYRWRGGWRCLFKLSCEYSYSEIRDPNVLYRWVVAVQPSSTVRFFSELFKLPILRCQMWFKRLVSGDFWTVFNCRSVWINLKKKMRKRICSDCIAIIGEMQI